MSHPLEPGLAEGLATRKATDPSQAEFKTSREQFLAPTESPNHDATKSADLTLDGTSFSYSRPHSTGELSPSNSVPHASGQGNRELTTGPATVLDNLVNWLSRRIERLMKFLLPSRSERRSRAQSTRRSKRTGSGTDLSLEEGAQGSFLVDRETLEEIRARRDPVGAMASSSPDLVISSGSDDDTSEEDGKENGRGKAEETREDSADLPAFHRTSET